MPDQADPAPGNATHLIRTESLHLAEMQVRQLVQTPLEERFNRLARMTQRALGARVAAISFLDADGEWFKAVMGWNVSRLPSGRSLAAALAHDGGVVAIPDLREEERSRDHPLVQGSPHFRFCALRPLRDRFGNAISATSVYDTEPREVTADLLEAVSDAGELAQRELLVHDMGGLQQELLAKLDLSRREALLDDLTRLWNRRGGMLLLEQALEDVRRGERTLGVCVVDIDEFKQVNDEFGHAMGDVVLRNVATALVNGVRPGDIVSRLAGDEFLLVIPDVEFGRLAGIMDRVRNRVQATIIRTRSASVRVKVSVGGAMAGPGYADAAEALVQAADEAMYGDKGGKRTPRPAAAIAR